MMDMVRKAYPTDLTDEQWAIIEPMLPQPKPRGRPLKYPRREILNAMFYITKGGGHWRMLPHEFPSWRIVYWYFGLWRDDGTLQRINAELVKHVREKVGRNPQPSAVVLDSQSVKTTARGEPGSVGYDGGKLIKGRKRHILVDTLGLLLIVMVHSAGLSDKKGARPLVDWATYSLPRLMVIYADLAYQGLWLDWRERVYTWFMHIVRRKPGTKGFQVLPKRWIVERTFVWLGKYRRLSKDYEYRTASSEVFIYLAMIHLMLRRMASHGKMNFSKQLLMDAVEPRWGSLLLAAREDLLRPGHRL